MAVRVTGLLTFIVFFCVAVDDSAPPAATASLGASIGAVAESASDAAVGRITVAATFPAISAGRLSLMVFGPAASGDEPTADSSDTRDVFLFSSDGSPADGGL
jgi:hypothetical protein